VHGTEEDMGAALERSAGQPWYPDALAALEKIFDGDLSMDAFRASRPLFYGRWNEVAQAHATAGTAERYLAARAGYFAGVDLDISSTRAALKGLRGPVLLYGGELDPDRDLRPATQGGTPVQQRARRRSS
jgi:pimeloyl-ACP methyl ester carboxylesterase